MDNNLGISDYFPKKYGKLLGFSRGHNPSKSSSLLCEGPKHSNISIIFQLLKRYVCTSLTPARSINLFFTSFISHLRETENSSKVIIPLKTNRRLICFLKEWKKMGHFINPDIPSQCCHQCPQEGHLILNGKLSLSCIRNTSGIQVDNSQFMKTVQTFIYRIGRNYEISRVFFLLEMPLSFEYFL